ncbi:MAG: SBBP repeat-containing protein [candidate division WOR-3 bacterium]
MSSKEGVKRIFRCPLKIIPKGKELKVVTEILLFSLLSYFPTSLYPQIWVAYYNGEANSDDCAIELKVDRGEDLYVTGYSYGLTNKKGYLTIKYNSTNGETLWTGRYEGIGNSEPKSLEVDSEGNIYVTGWSEDEHGYRDILTIKYSPSGDILWIKRYNNGLSNHHDEPTKMVIDLQNNIYITGFSYNWGTGYDYLLIKYDKEGNERWVRMYNGPGDSTDKSNSVAVDKEGNIYIAGMSYGLETKGDFATVKYDSLGNLIWVRRFDDTLNFYNDEALGVGVDSFNNVYVAGLSGFMDFLTFTLIKYNSPGEERWVVKSEAGASGDILRAMSVSQDGKIYLTGSYIGWHTTENYKTEMYDSSGYRYWVKFYDSDSLGDGSFGLVTDDLGNVYVTGRSALFQTNYDYLTIKYNPSGGEEWVARYGGPGDDEASAIALDERGNVYVTGRSRGLNTSYDYCTVKYPPFGPGVEEYKNKRGDNLHRGIIQKKLTLIPKGKIFNCQGRLTKREDVSSGIYFILRRDKSGDINKKLVIVK